MSPERWEKVKDLFVELEARPAAVRAGYLAEHCANDPELRAEVERLLANDPSVALIDRSPFPQGILRGAASNTSSITVGAMLADRFRVLRLLGSGGMGDVYQAEDTRLNQTVAIKTIRTEIAADAGAIARFRREISLARQVTHPGICRVYDFFSAPTSIPGQTVDFLTMEFVEGETLSALLKREGPLSFETALPVVEQIASALDAAHEARVMHRDLKSSNVILGKQAGGALRAVVTDFGVARSMAGGDTIATGSGFAAGTPAYMAPEQLEGRELTHAADFYSLGVLMYEMATGTTPHAADSPLQIAARRMKEPPVPPGQLRPIPRVWEAAILKCLELEPSHRFPSGAALVDALQSATPVKAQRRPLRLPRFTLATAIAIPLLAASVWLGRDYIPAKPVSEQAARFHRDGVIALADGAYHKASQLLQMAVQAEPSFAAAHCRLAEAYQELDQRDKAREELVKALDAPAWARHERLLRDATKFYLTGDWNQAADALRQRIGSVPSSERTAAMLDLARFYDRAGKSKDAVEAYRNVLQRDSSQPSAALRLAALLYASGKRKEVVPLLDRAEKLYAVMQNPEGAGLLHLARGEMAANTDQSIAQAEKAEEIARQISSPSLEIQAKLLHARRVDYKGKGEIARTLAKDAVALAESKGLGALAARGLADLGMVPFSQRRYEEAEPLFLQAIALAQRYGAKRTEALAKMNLAHLSIYQSDTAKLNNGLEILREAADYFTSVGDTSRLLQALRYRSSIFKSLGKLEESRLEQEKILARSETPEDIAAVRTTIGKTALDQGKFDLAAKIFSESAAYFKSIGDRQTEQNFVMYHARALRSAGGLEESFAILRKLESEGLANAAVRNAYDNEVAGLEFQLMKFDQSLQRLERLASEAAKNGQKGLEKAFRLNLCLKYGEAERVAQALALCPGMLQDYEGQASRLAVIHQALSTAYRADGKFDLAIRHAKAALSLAKEGKDHEDITYAWILLTQALHAAGNSEWKAARERTLNAIEDWKQEVGSDLPARYYRRPVTARRFNAVLAMQ